MSCIAAGNPTAPIMLAPGERLGVVDVAQPGVLYEIVAPADRALPLDGVLNVLGKGGVSGVVNASRKSANVVVLDDAGRLQLKSTVPAVPSMPAVGDHVVIKSGMIVLDRGKVAIYVDQLPQPGKPAVLLQNAGLVNPPLTAISPNILNGLSPAQIAPPSGAVTGVNPVPQVVSSPAPTLSAPGVSGANPSIALQTAPVILPGSAVLIPLTPGGVTLSGGSLAGFQTGQISTGGGFFTSKGAVSLNGVGSSNTPAGITGTLQKNPIGVTLISTVPGK
jgi:hypothetical protein